MTGVTGTQLVYTRKHTHTRTHTGMHRTEVHECRLEEMTQKVQLLSWNFFFFRSKYKNLGVLLSQSTESKNVNFAVCCRNVLFFLSLK